MKSDIEFLREIISDNQNNPELKTQLERFETIAKSIDENEKVSGRIALMLTVAESENEKHIEEIKTLEIRVEAELKLCTQRGIDLAATKTVLINFIKNNC